MASTSFWSRALLFFGTAVVLAACSSGPQITRTHDVSESADTPYENVLVIALFSTFETRWRLEKEVVNKLSELGIDAVASTSMMTPKSPVTRQAFAAMVEELGSDAVLVTQLVDIDSKAAMVDSASPKGSYKFHSTYYYNVWEVEQKEFVEPQILNVKSLVVLTTELYSVLTREVVWAIESKIKLVQQGITGENFGAFVDEADAIVNHMSRDRLIAR